MQLPVALQPWRPWLDWFAPDLALTLGDLLWRLQPLLGPQRSGSTGTVEPVGIDDLRRRGNYERLLLSEWALADALPEEFLRRAASGEHLFLAPREVRRREAGHCIAWFDAGPLQLGAPRLIHLATWILLARRAEAMGMTFLWGIVQAPGVVHEATEPEQLRKLLSARTLSPATAQHWQAWSRWRTDEKVVASECWHIGPAGAATDLITHEVQALCAVLGKELDITVQEGARRRSLTLPLPEQGAALRLLQGNFLLSTPADTNTHQRPRGVLSIKQPPLLSLEGRHVVVPKLSGGVIIFHIPDAPGGRSKRPQWENQWSQQHSLLAGALRGKNFGGLLSGNNRLHFWQIPLSQEPQLPSRDIFQALPGLAHWLPAFWLREGREDRFYVLDKQGNLAFWHRRQYQPQIHARNVLGIAQTGAARILYARFDEGHLLLESVGIDSSPANASLGKFAIPPQTSAQRVLFATGTRWLMARSAWAVEYKQVFADGPAQWALYLPTGFADFTPLELTVPAAWTVYGVVMVRVQHEASFALLAVGADRRSLMLVTAAGAEKIYTSPDDVAVLSVGGNGVVAWLTQGRQLMVFSIQHQALLLSVHGPAKSEDDES